MKSFNEPKLEVSAFEVEDVITASPDPSESKDPDEMGGMPI